MYDKSPRQSASKKASKSIKEKPAVSARGRPAAAEPEHASHPVFCPDTDTDNTRSAGE
jgi:hypothetical protein